MSEIIRRARSHEKSVTRPGRRREESTDARVPDTHPGCRELAYRSNGGLEVRLLWHPPTDELMVCVSDRRLGTYFEIRPEHESALDVYYHPYSYVALATGSTTTSAERERST